jgi:hypothetical protein
MYSKGISWIDDCRIPFVDEGDKQKGKIHDAGGNGEGKYNWNTIIKKSGNEYRVSQGRFPANLLVSDDMLNDGVITKSEGRKIYENENININNNVYNDGWKRQKSDIKDKGTNSRYYDIDKWFDKIIDV